MRRRTGYNPKREIAAVGSVALELLARLSGSVRYGGNPEHKRSPGDFGLTPPAYPRPGKTLCDAERPILLEEARTLLSEGLRRGVVSPIQDGEWPKNIWAVSQQGEVFEAQLENVTLGVYHGYPMPLDDDFREKVVQAWRDRE